MFRTIQTYAGWLVLLYFAVGTTTAHAQSDSKLSYEDFITLVKSNHPVAKQAALLAKAAQQENLIAKGAFDPKLYYDVSQKSFSDKLYFSVGEGGVKLPTWGGVELKGNYNYAAGNFVNPEESLPINGQAVLGISANLLSGLRIDERRANYKIAKISTALNDDQIKIIVNDLVLEASVAYWNWAVINQQVKIANTALEIANVRFQNLKTSYLAGDKAAVDTLEVLIQIQERQNELIEMKNDWILAGLELSNFMWDRRQTPLAITESIVPDSIILDKPILNALSDQSIDIRTHPYLSYYKNKGLQLDISKRLKSEKLLPQLNVSYNILGNGPQFGSSKDGFSMNSLLIQNNKFGIQFYSPILYRQERGQVELAKLKILENEYNLTQKERTLNTKVAQLQTELRNTLQQLTIHEQLVENYRQLLSAENRKFSIGESSVFLVNARERKLLEGMNKLAKLQGTSKKLTYKLDWAKGLLF